MALMRKVRARGATLVVAVPHDLAQMLELGPGDSISFDVLGREQLLLRVVRRPAAPPPSAP
jgi:antitoxin component of MazEF toxin-antitoxin module